MVKYKRCYLCGAQGAKENVTLHSFSKYLEKEWKESCDLLENDEVKALLICSKHFTDDDYYDPESHQLCIPRLKLKPSAIPTVKVPNSKYKYKSSSLASKINGTPNSQSVLNSSDNILGQISVVEKSSEERNNKAYAVGNVNFDRICRICAYEPIRNDEELMPLFCTQVVNDSTIAGIFLKKLTNLDITSDDRLPQNICITCLAYLSGVHVFITKCHKSHDKFLNMLHQDDSSSHQEFRIENRLDANNFTLTRAETVSDSKDQDEYHTLHVESNVRASGSKDHDEYGGKHIERSAHSADFKDHLDYYKRPIQHSVQASGSIDHDEYDREHIEPNAHSSDFKDNGKNYKRPSVQASGSKDHDGYYERPIQHSVQVSGLGYHDEHGREYIESNSHASGSRDHVEYDEAQTKDLFIPELHDHYSLYVKENDGVVESIESECGSPISNSILDDKSSSQEAEETEEIILEISGMKATKYVESNSRPKTLAVQSSPLSCAVVGKGKAKIMYPCEICHKEFTFKTNYTKHKKNFHTHPVESYPCTTCKKKFKLEKDLNIHYRIKHTSLPQKEELSHTCHICNKSFLRRYKLKEHLLTHSSEKNYKCDICHKAFYTQRRLREHRQRHTEQLTFPCDICEKLFKQRQDVRQHKRVVHSGKKEAKVTCEICGKVVRKITFQNHLNLHTGVMTEQCDICGKCFYSKPSYRQHMRTVHESDAKEFICGTCNKGFRQKQYLKKHILAIHLNQKDFLCYICNKGFFSQLQLELHLASHLDYRPFVCDICGDKAFKTKPQLTIHKRSYHSDRQRVCAICGKSFNFQLYWAHFYSHGTNKVICEFCGKMVPRKSHQKHLMSHREETPLTCPICYTGFTTNSSLEEHFGTVHYADVE